MSSGPPEAAGMAAKNPTSVGARRRSGIKKRKYSRNGCNECKRRKIKCDEAPKSCLNCSRLNKVCVYVLESKFKIANVGPEKTASRSPNGERGSFNGSRTALPGLESFGVPHGGIFPASSPTNMMIPHEPPSATYEPRIGFRNTISDILSPPELVSADMAMLFNEASSLVNDMNHLVTVDLSENNYNLNSTAHSVGSLDSERHNFCVADLTHAICSGHQHHVNDIVAAETELLSRPNSALLAEVVAQNSLVEPHTSYLEMLMATELSYHLFPFAYSVESNAVVKLLLIYARNCPYLVTALLAISATFQYNQTGRQVHEETTQKYVSVCLRSLSQAFVASGEAKSLDALANDIERLLLTVLVLTSNFTASHAKKDGLLSLWRTHLRGARDLLTSYSKLAHARRNAPMSGGLALARMWFFAMESLAGLSLSHGGTLAGGSDIFVETGHFSRDLNPGYCEALLRVGLVTCTTYTVVEFSLFLGCTMSYVRLTEALIGAFDELRESPGQLPAARVAQLVGLVHDAYETTVVFGTDTTSCIIAKTSPSHPEYVGQRTLLPEAAYGCEKAADGSLIYRSWFDLSQQIHLDMLYLKILTLPGFLAVPRNHPLVRELVGRILGYLYFVKPKTGPVDRTEVLAETDHFYLSRTEFDLRSIMLQSPFRFCMDLVADALSFEKIELYFTGLVRLGNGSLLAALDIVNRLRERARTTEKFSSATLEINEVPVLDRSLDSDLAFA